MELILGAIKNKHKCIRWNLKYKCIIANILSHPSKNTLSRGVPRKRRLTSGQGRTPVNHKADTGRWKISTLPSVVSLLAQSEREINIQYLDLGQAHEEKELMQLWSSSTSSIHLFIISTHCPHPAVEGWGTPCTGDIEITNHSLSHSHQGQFRVIS